MTKPVIAILLNTKEGTYHPITLVYNHAGPYGGENALFCNKHKDRIQRIIGFNTKEEAEKDILDTLVPMVKNQFGEPMVAVDDVIPWDGTPRPSIVGVFNEDGTMTFENY